MPELQEPKLRAPAPPDIIRVAPCPLDYAELDVTSNFSFLRGASHPDELVQQAALLGYRAIAITDHNSLAGIVRAHSTAKEIGLKFIVGTKIELSVSSSEPADLSVLLWPTDRAAYGRLCRLLTLGKRRAEKGQCRLFMSDLLDMNHGLLAAAIPNDLQQPQAITSLRLLREAFTDRLCLAVSCLYSSDDVTHLEHWADTSRRLHIPLLATNHVHYHDPNRRRLQDVVTCIRHGCTIHQAGYRLFPHGERYLKSPAQMHRLFGSLPGTLARGIEIAERCAFSLDELRYEYPHEIVPAGQSSLEYLTELTWRGAQQRYPSGIPDKVRGIIEHELILISQMHFEAYFLTVHDLVRFARARGILCQGRGSAANSAVCYCLGVTSVDPARVDVLFERFISAARNEPPDIDIDFEHEKREEVIQYIYDKYGRERSGMTAEVITYRGRSAVRDVGKALGLGLDVVDAMAKRMDWWERGTVNDDKLREIGLDPRDRTVKLVVELSGQLLGFPRHLSQHVGGMVMTQGPLCEMVPIENAAMENRTTIEWDKDDIDALGILKVDVLALGMLTCIAKALELVNATRSTDAPPLELHTIPAEDPAVYEMASHADTVGVFQIESRAQMAMLPRLRPRCFYDLVIEVAIVRPGPIQGRMVHPYLRRRSGEEPVTYASDALRSVLEKTLGVPLFQEQAMRLVMVAAGFSAEEADRLRRAMAAWKRSGGIDIFHEKIIRGMMENGYSQEFAQQSFIQIRGFGEYGFPESHAASFALLVYSSAWLKRRHPGVFAAALLNSQPMGFYAPAQIIRDASDHGVTVRPIDINASQWDSALEPSPTPSLCAGDAPNTWGHGGPALRLGFRLISGFRSADAQRLVTARQRIGTFTSLHQLHQVAGLSRAALRRLADGDAFGSLGLTRRQALWQVMQISDDHLPLFDPLTDQEPPAPLPVMPLRQEVLSDYSAVGFSLKQHPVALVRAQLAQRRIVPAKDLWNLPHGRWVHVAGLVLIRQRPGTAAGIVFETLEDETGIVNLIVKPEVFERYRQAARHSTLLYAQGKVERHGEVMHVMVKWMEDLSSWLLGCMQPSRDFH